MGSPRQTFAGETRSSRQCRWPRAAKVVFLPKVFIEDKKISPTPKRPNTFRSVVDLSTTVIQDELFKKLKPSKKEKKTEAFLHFLKSKKPSSQLDFELSLVKTISPIHRPTLSEVERRHFQTSMKS